MIGSRGIQEILESEKLEDISFLVAEQFVQAGVPARAIAGARPEQLKPDELLLRGGVIVREARLRPAFILSVCTLLIIGAWLPSPLPFYGEALADYRIEIVDPSSNILLQTGDQRSNVIWRKSYSLWGLAPYDWKDRTSDIMPKALVEAILKSFDQQVVGQ